MVGQPNLKLKAARVEKGLTQEEMAKMAKMSTPTYIKKENGESRFYVDEAETIAGIVGKSPMEIFFTNRYTNCITDPTLKPTGTA